MEAGILNYLTVMSKSSDFGVHPAYAECFRETGRHTPGVRQNGFLQENNHNFRECYRKGPRLKYTARKSKILPNPFRRGRGQGTVNLYQ